MSFEKRYLFVIISIIACNLAWLSTYYSLSWVRYIYWSYSPRPIPPEIAFLMEFVRFSTRGLVLLFFLVQPVYYFERTLRNGLVFYLSVIFMVLFFLKAALGLIVRVFFYNSYLLDIISVRPLSGAWPALIVAVLMFVSARVVRNPEAKTAQR